jgi:hypothetical protein
MHHRTPPAGLRAGRFYFVFDLEIAWFFPGGTMGTWHKVSAKHPRFISSSQCCTDSAKSPSGRSDVATAKATMFGAFPSYRSVAI